MEPLQTRTLAPIQTDLDALYRQFVSYLDAREKTVQTYTRSLRQFFHYLADQGIAQPQREDVIAFRASLKQSHKPATVQSYIVAVRLFFQWTESERLYPNIAQNVKGATIDRAHKKDYLTALQTQSVLQAIPRDDVRGARDYALLSVMVTAGLRTVEVARSDVRDLGVAGGQAVLYIQGKGKDEKSDYVKLAAPVEQALRAYLKVRGPVDADAPLFASLSHRDEGARLTTRSISRIVKDRLIAAGFDSERLTAHSLRHTAATLNLLAGGTLEETQQLLRHTSLNTTMIYNHQLDREKNQSESRVAQAIFEEENG